MHERALGTHSGAATNGSEIGGANRQLGEGNFVPVVITTHEVAKDAAELLLETRETAQFLEQSEGKVDSFIKGIIGKIDHQDSRRRFIALTSAQNDSIAELAGNQIRQAFASWYDEDSAVV
jgi:hypothetical protein